MASRGGRGGVLGERLGGGDQERLGLGETPLRRQATSEQAPGVGRLPVPLGQRLSAATFFLLTSGVWVDPSVAGLAWSDPSTAASIAP